MGKERRGGGKSEGECLASAAGGTLARRLLAGDDPRPTKGDSRLRGTREPLHQRATDVLVPCPDTCPHENHHHVVHLSPTSLTLNPYLTLNPNSHHTCPT